MPEEMPEELRDAFHQVLVHHLRWRGEQPEPTVIYKTETGTISAICRLVDDPKFAPEDVLEYLLRRIRH
jgi:hypothetical protein